ncbi:glycosyltransferase [Candidatus Gottesmanbacteria bacterium]|nr:glycosyltransferase [Candidatus Gottesmanbacteria bacterium]
MKLSIVIPVYNEEKYIGRTLKSVQSLEKNDWDVEVLVVDGGSNDDTVRIAREWGAKVISVTHKGIGFARQQGLKNAIGDIVLFTDADTILANDWLSHHVEALKRPGVVFSYGPFKVTDGSFPYYHFINYIQYYGWILLSIILPRPFAAGQNMAFWREAGERIGGFDTNLLILEDTDFSLRIAKIGKTAFVKDALVYSSGRRSKEGWQFFFRITKAIFKYFILGKRHLEIFPDFR